ncbi:PfkB family carbohydrate kinase [Bifidobacterium canis]|uniref:Sugar kinase n=1 Tax=Bifidobacterium canis TaxID=2610880 RepID=A0A7K1J4F6_9BIFI|nr:PfkB family carbohydrate kinase [Bifidobacterium canis]MUH59538.1 sugar kinase [Bifidobacterium canis]
MLSDILHSIQAHRDHEPTVISLGQIWVDVMIKVPQFPVPGSFISAESYSRSVNGSFAVLEAASRMGAHTELASVLGTGPWSDMIRTALAHANIRHTGLTNKTVDNGSRLVINDGEQRSFISAPGAEVHTDEKTFEHVHPKTGDVVHINGASLMNNGATAVAEFISRPECAVAMRDFQIVFNPTSMVSTVNERLFEDLVLLHPIWSLNRQQGRAIADRLGIELDESASMRVDGGFDESMSNLCDSLAEVLRAPVVLRAGSRGAWLREHGKQTEHIDGFETKATHIRSAGPTHTGALCALLANGWNLESAVQIANAAASLAISKNINGVPQCPTFDEAAELVKKALAELNAEENNLNNYYSFSSPAPRRSALHSHSIVSSPE